MREDTKRILMARRAREARERQKREKEYKALLEERARFAAQQEPCPFCDTHNLSVQHFLDSSFIYCSGCHAEGPHVDSEAEAWDAWNARPTRDAE